MVSKLTSVFLLAVILAVALADEYVKIDEETEPYEFPSHISLEWNYNGDKNFGPLHFCGGSLLDEYHVLTMFFCNYTFSPNGFLEVVAAEHNVLQHEGPEQRRKVISFVKQESSTIAVIRVDKPFELNDKVKSVRLSRDREQINGNVTITGWGMRYSKMHKVLLPLATLATCERFWTFLQEFEICVGVFDGPKSYCNTDVGGPLFKLVGNEMVQIGVANWNMIMCSLPMRPAVYDNVAYFVDWIEDQLKW